MDRLDLEDYLTHGDDEAPEDDQWECCLPGQCLMQGEHMRSECYTVEMAQEYAEATEAEATPAAPQ